MDRKYIILVLILVTLAGGLLLLPDKGTDKNLKPKQMLLSINDDARYLSTDLITKRMIEADPTLQLIDVRKPDDFRVFALQGAVNIPLDSLLSDSWVDLLNQPGKDKVFYSNGDIDAEKAWMICKRMNTERVFIMKGGLNQWFETVINAKEPDATAPAEAFDTYKFRVAAKQFFTGIGAPATTVPAKNQEKKAPAPVNVQKKAHSTGGGC